jgi:hypothetical protein
VANAAEPTEPKVATDDDPSIPSDELLYRRIPQGTSNFVAIDQITGARKPSSGVFKPDTDGISVYRHTMLLENGLGPSDLVRQPLNLIVSVTVEDVRSLDLGVHDDAWPCDADEPNHLRNATHALIVGMAKMGKNERIRTQKKLASLPSIKFVVDPARDNS